MANKKNAQGNGQTLESLLLKPYIEVPTQDGPVRITATKADVDRIRNGADEFTKSLDGFMSSDGPSLDEVKGAFEFLCGPEVGAELFTKCIDYATDNGRYEPEEVTYQLVPVLEYIEFQWLDYVDHMNVERSERVKKYLGDGTLSAPL